MELDKSNALGELQVVIGILCVSQLGTSVLDIHNPYRMISISAVGTFEANRKYTLLEKVYLKNIQFKYVQLL